MRIKASTVLPEDENVVLAYKAKSEKIYFTRYRIVFKSDPAPRYQYHTLPYTQIGGWKHDVERAKQTLTLYTVNKVDECAKREIVFWKAGRGLDMHEVIGLLSTYALPVEDPYGNVEAGLRQVMDGEEIHEHEDWEDMLFPDGDQPTPDEAMYTFAGKLLHPQEEVDQIFKTDTEITMFTSKRLLLLKRCPIVDSTAAWKEDDDLIGDDEEKERKAQAANNYFSYTTIMWARIRMFSVATGGSIWDDAVLKFYFDLPALPSYTQDLSWAGCDVQRIQDALTDLTCGYCAKKLS